MIVATPSGTTLAPEGGAHQSINPPLIALGQPGLRHYEPAFADELAARYPKIGSLMDDAKAEVLAFAAFPRVHWTKLWSNNPLERINKEIKRRSNVVIKWLDPITYDNGNETFSVQGASTPGTATAANSGRVRVTITRWSGAARA